MYPNAPRPELQSFSDWNKREDPKWLLQTDRLPAALVKEVKGYAQHTDGAFDNPKIRIEVLLAAQAMGYPEAGDRALERAADYVDSGKPGLQKHGRMIASSVATNAAAYGNLEQLGLARELNADMASAYRVAVMGANHHNGRASLREIVNPSQDAVGYKPTKQDELFAGMALANVNLIQKSLDNGATFSDNGIMQGVARLAEASVSRGSQNSIADRQSDAVSMILKHLKETDQPTIHKVKSIMATSPNMASVRGDMNAALNR